MPRNDPPTTLAPSDAGLVAGVILLAGVAPLVLLAAAELIRLAAAGARP